MDKNKVIVIGHKNPDTDSICAAISYAYLKNELNNGGFQACRAGEISEETKYVLDRFEMKAPELVKNVATSVSDLKIIEAPGISANSTMRKAWNAMRENKIGVQPIVDENGILKGMISMNDIAKRHMDAIDADVLAESKTPAQNIVEILEGKVLTGKTEGNIESGKIVIGAAGEEEFEAVISEGDIVILAGRAELQKAAINNGAAVMVVCSDADVPDLLIDAAEESGCLVIGTQYGTYEATNLLIQSPGIGSFMTTYEKLVTFTTETTLAEVEDTIKDLRHVYYPIICEETGKYVGVISRRNLLGENGKKLILVDHNEPTQVVDGHNDATVLEVVDHHRLAPVQTTDPIMVRFQPVGCTCTILYQMYKEREIEIPKNIAGVMLSAILSDTLCLTSPTCTATDKNTVYALADIVGVNYEELAEEMFGAGEKLDGKSAEEVCYQDYKVFTNGDVRFGIGQASFMSLKNLETARDMVLPYLHETLEKDNTNMVFFMLTSIRDNGSYIICAGEGAAELLKRAFGEDPDENQATWLPGVVSRKKQMAPGVMENL